MKEVYIVDAARTAVGNFGGSLASVSAVDLGKTVTKAILDRNKLTGGEIDDVVLPCVRCFDVRRVTNFLRFY